MRARRYLHELFRQLETTMFVGIQHFASRLRRPCLFSENSPAQRPFIWIIAAVLFGFVLYRAFFSSPVQHHRSSSNVSGKKGIHFLGAPKLLSGPQVDENSSLKDVRERYYKEQTTDHVQCYPQRRIGKVKDGGWDICQFGNFKLQSPCLAYSFGVEFEWLYDEVLAKDFGCVVRAFDPSMDVRQHIHMPGPVHFFPYGLAGKNTVWPNMFVRSSKSYFSKKTKASWIMKTLGTLIEMNKDQGKIIDILKIDIEYSEWDVFENILSTGILKNVKLLQFESHTNELNGRSTTKTDFLRYLSIIRQIEALGFRKYKSHYNHHGVGPVRDVAWKNGEISVFEYLITYKRTCCYEQYYLNVNHIAT